MHGVSVHMQFLFGAFSSDTFYIDCCISALYLSTSQVLSIHSMPSSDDIAILIEAAKSRVASAEVRVVSAEQDLTSARSYLSSLENQFDLQFQQELVANESNIRDRGAAAADARIECEKIPANNNDDGVERRNVCSVDGCKLTVKRRGLCYSHIREVSNIRASASNDGPICSMFGCGNNAAGGGKCRKHGGKTIYKRCSVEGCVKHVVNNGVCKSHGAISTLCSVQGCDNQAKSQGVCIRHGAVTRKKCRVEGCDKHAINLGVCISHGANRRQCHVDGCEKWALQKGVCISHGAKVAKKLCSHEGCTNIVVQGRVCTRHGAKRKRKRCSVEGCINQEQKGGVCIRHGARKQKLP